MQSLKQIVFSKLQRLMLVMLVSVLLMALLLQLIMVQAQAKENAAVTFVQVGQIIQENHTALLEAEEQYMETCLLNAETIAYLIQRYPEILGDVEEFRRIAVMIQVDEIHIFDTTGRIFTGSHPEYYDYTFDSGEQIQFFKPLLHDKSLRLCQDITPNTAEGKLVQYSALWSSDEQFIVQVGMYPDAILELTEKNELSYIFTLLQGTPGVSLYAIDAETGGILGSTTGSDTGKNLESLGTTLTAIERCRRGAHVSIGGVDSYCVMEEVEGMLIAYVIANDTLYGSIANYTVVLAFCILLLFVVFVALIMRIYSRYISDALTATNEKLHAIAEGNLEERVNVQNTLEFYNLSEYINRMVGSLLAETDKMNMVLNRTNMPIGVYEYSPRMKMVRYTEHIPDIFGKSSGEMASLAVDAQCWKSFTDTLCQEKVPHMENTYLLQGEKEKYIRLEEIVGESEVLGIVMDVTESTVNLREAETERDRDQLTGLYNRRGIERHIHAMLEDGPLPGYGVMVMIDSDDLKSMNDQHGHSTGDMYLKRLADLISMYGVGEKLTARMSGDEFLMVLYGYETAEALEEEIATFRRIRDKATFMLADGTALPLRFSMGYVSTYNRCDYSTMLAEADSAMYAEKRSRKISR